MRTSSICQAPPASVTLNFSAAWATRPRASVRPLGRVDRVGWTPVGHRAVGQTGQRNAEAPAEQIDDDADLQVAAWGYLTGEEPQVAHRGIDARVRQGDRAARRDGQRLVVRPAEHVPRLVARGQRSAGGHGAGRQRSTFERAPGRGEVAVGVAELSQRRGAGDGAGQDAAAATPVLASTPNAVIAARRPSPLRIRGWMTNGM